MQNKFGLLFLLLSVGGFTAYGQQSPRLSQYNFAPALYNPAAVGSSEYWTLGGAFRGQWIGIEGAPSTQVLFADKSFDRVGMGVQLRNDLAGTLGITDCSAAYAYKIPLSPALVLRGGLSASLSNWRNDFSKLRLDDIDDPQFLVNINRWMPNFGMGLQLNHHWGSIGLGVPKLFEYNLNTGSDAVAGRALRHYFLQANGHIELLNKALILQPQAVLASSTLFNTSNRSFSAPNALDLGITAVVETHWRAGIQWRTALERSLSSDHALGLLAGWTNSKGFGVNAVYEIPLNAIRKVSDASFEILFTVALQSAEKPPRPTTEKPSIPISVGPIPTPKKDIPVASEPVPEIKIQGIVFDMTTGLPTEGARIVLSNACGESAPLAWITPADGRYQFTLSANCCYTVTAQKDNRKMAVSEKICTQNNGSAQVLRADLDLFQQ